MRLLHTYTHMNRDVSVWHRDQTHGGSPLSKITFGKDGPYLISGNLPLAKVTVGTNAKGESVR
jgi:hypothetical protein